MNNKAKIETMISLPPGMLGYLESCEPRIAKGCFAASDPIGHQLGSGGGTAHLLAEAWQAAPAGQSFAAWLNSSQKLMIHGSGQSRRLPAYAATGKLFIPVPAYRWKLGHRVDQTLLDLQEPFLRNVCQQATAASRLLIASGDVLLRNEKPLPPLPEADVIMLGLWTTPEEAQNFGVMFTSPNDPTKLVTFLQKPSPDLIREKAGQHIFMVDVGVWLLSERAVRLLMERSGWDSEADCFRNGSAEFYDLYSDWGLHLGEHPNQPDKEISQLTTAVIPVPEGGFYHFGKSRDIIESVYRLQNLVIDQHQLGALGRQPHPKQFCQNTHFEPTLRHSDNHSLWIENSHIPASWKIACEHILTGVPENSWKLKLEAGVCLDFAPIGNDCYAIRAYGMDDPSRGKISNPATLWLGRPALDWFKVRKLPISQELARLDIQDAPIFPVLEHKNITPQFIEWLFSRSPLDSQTMREQWLTANCLSATGIIKKINLERLYQQRRQQLQQALPLMASNYTKSIFYKLDLRATATLYAESGAPLPDVRVPANSPSPLIAVHERMFRAAVLRERNSDRYKALENEAADLLHKAVVKPFKEHQVIPRIDVLDDQIVWGRAPARMDIAGGWSDTPPYCLEHGGRVLNMAVNLNGQPPIQVFARKISKQELVIRSIDLGVEERLQSYNDVQQYSNLASGFTIARAAFALAGFDPEFNGQHYCSLQEQLAELGAGIELTMLAAIPKGSGLGTSSILAATLLGTLADFCGLHWDRFDICQRTMALEQMLTSGGGWQDQFGGVFHGTKLIETTPGIDQRPTMRWVPEKFFTNSATSERMLLYYTGITRVAHNILGEIVRNIFLNSRDQLDTISDISTTALLAYDAVQRDDHDGFADAVGRSWQLNQQLDPGTNVPGVQQIIEQCGQHLRAAKLLGAGGGGYMLMIAKSASDANRIRRVLTENPPNTKARFVEVSLSTSGLQITRS